MVVQTTDPAGDNYSYPPPSSFGPGNNVVVATGDVPSVNPDPSVLAAPEQVTYHCTGHAPDGVDITYGPNGSEHSAHKLPFTHVEPLTPQAEYYVTTAQLGGSGDVSCTTTVQVDDLDGVADPTSNTGSADGGYKIASAQVCFFQGWQAC